MPKKEAKPKKPRKTRGHSTRSSKHSKKSKTTQKTTVIVHSSGGGSGGGGFIPFPQQYSQHEPIVLNNYIPTTNTPSPFQTIKEVPASNSISNTTQTDPTPVASFSTQTELEPIKMSSFKTPKTVRKPVVRLAKSDSEYDPDFEQFRETFNEPLPIYRQVSTEAPVIYPDPAEAEAGITRGRRIRTDMSAEERAKMDARNARARERRASAKKGYGSD